MAGKSPAYICSAALNRIGADSITSLSDSSKRGVLCNRLWPVVRDAVLASRNWGITLERAVLTKDNDAPAYDYATRFQVPADMFLLLGTDLPRDARWVIENDFILCDYDALSILYIKDTPNSESFGPLLTDALVAAMAAELAYPITGSMQTKDSMDKEKDLKIGLAATRESQQKSVQQFGSDLLIRVRR